MFIGRMGALLAGASPIPAALALAPAPETKDANVDVETKAAVDQLAKDWEDFKKKNDQRLDQIESKRGADAVTKDEIEKQNKALDDAIAAVRKRLDEAEAKANRQALSGGDVAIEAKNARAFAELTGQKGYTPEQLGEYKGDLGNYLRRNEVKATTMMVAADPAGGFWVTPDVSGRMVQKIYETTPMRQLASVVSIGTDRLEGPIDNGEGDAAWVGETQVRSQTDMAQLGMWAIDVNELYAYPMVTQKLLEDAKIDVEAWIAAKSVSKFARKESTAFVLGDGVQKPKGLLVYPTAVADDANRPWGTFQYVATGGAAGFAAANPADALIDLIFALKAGYRQNARFMTSRKTLGTVRKLKDGQGNYLVDLRLRDGALVESIFGYGVADGEDMPAIGANALPMAFGDFAEAYTIVDRAGISTVRDNITRPGFVKYHMRKRVGGGAVNFEALKFLKVAAN